MTITLTATTDAAVDAIQDYSHRRNVCVQAVIDAAGAVGYCACAGCLEADEAMMEGIRYAEGAWLRAAESTEYPCYCGVGQGGICC